jgi:hypothetical protein
LVSRKLYEGKVAADIDIFDPKIVSNKKKIGKGNIYDPNGNDLSSDNAIGGNKIPLKK